MKIFIRSNFVVPGLEEKESLDIDQPEISLKDFLEKLSMMSSNRLEYIESDSLEINPEDWDIKINDKSYQTYGAGLDHPLRDGDIVTINIQPIGGG